VLHLKLQHCPRVTLYVLVSVTCAAFNSYPEYCLFSVKLGLVSAHECTINL
jgi:hypothetical protein